VKVAVVYFEALVLLLEKETAAGLVPVVLQDIMRFGSPPSSAPRTSGWLSFRRRRFAEAVAGITTVGAALAMVTIAVWCTEPLETITSAKPGVPGDVYRPELLIDPPPELIDQLSAGVAMESPN
jgi:hypothetical protein